MLIRFLSHKYHTYLIFYDNLLPRVLETCVEEVDCSMSKGVHEYKQLSTPNENLNRTIKWGLFLSFHTFICKLFKIFI